MALERVIYVVYLPIMFERAAIFSGLLVLIAFLTVGLIYYQKLDPEDRVVPNLNVKQFLTE